MSPPDEARAHDLPAPGAGPRHGWIWAVLPADCESAEIFGEDGLGALLRDAGVPRVLEDVPGGGEADIIVLGLEDLREGGFAVFAPRLRAGGVMATPVESEPLWALAGSRAGRLPRRLRAARQAGSEADRLEGAMRASGLETRRISTGDRSRVHRIGLAGSRVAAGPGMVVTGSRGAPRASVLSRCVSAAATDLGVPVEIRRATVRGSGALLLELGTDRGGHYLLRLVAGPSRVLQDAALRSLRAIEAEAPSDVRERLVLPVAEGEVGLARYAVENLEPGARPRRLSRSLWADCLRFLIGLRACRAVSPAHPQALAMDARVLEPHLDRREQRTLGQLVGALAPRLGELPGGWAHGDFWPGNLLARRGRLVAVVDWDGASPAALPLLDLLHLIALGRRDLRRLPHGRRCIAALWPLARRGGDARIRAYCEATATPDEPATLEALAFAYWLTRVARDLRMFGDRAGRSEWMRENLQAPLAVIAGR